MEGVVCGDVPELQVQVGELMNGRQQKEFEVEDLRRRVEEVERGEKEEEGREMLEELREEKEDLREYVDSLHEGMCFFLGVLFGVLNSWLPCGTQKWRCYGQRRSRLLR